MAEPRRAWLRRAVGLAVATANVRLLADGTASTWRVGFITPYPPFSEVNPRSGQVDGFDVQVVRALAQSRLVRLQLVHTGAQQILSWLERGQLDFVGNQLLATADMRERFIFADGYVDLRLILCQRENDNRDFLSLEDFLGHKLGVLADTAADTQGSAVLGPDLRRFATTRAGLAALLAGEIDAFVDESLILDHLIFKHRLALKTTTPLSPPIRTGWAVGKSNLSLRQQLNQGVAWLKSSGQIKRISEPLFGYDVSQKRAGAMILEAAPKGRTPAQKTPR